MAFASGRLFAIDAMLYALLATSSPKVSLSLMGEGVRCIIQALVSASFIRSGTNILSASNRYEEGPAHDSFTISEARSCSVRRVAALCYGILGLRLSASAHTANFSGSFRRRRHRPHPPHRSVRFLLSAHSLPRGRRSRPHWRLH